MGSEAVEEGAEGVSLKVSNSGSRLSQDEAVAATQRFWRGDTARSEAGLHCGLGLSLVEKATRALGGAVEIHSSAGGVFSVEATLPGQESVEEALPGAVDS